METKRRAVGRPAKHLDAADRQAAYRERRADELALGAAAQALIAKPSPAFVRMMIDRMLGQAADRDRVRKELAAYVAGAAGAVPTE